MKLTKTFTTFGALALVAGGTLLAVQQVKADEVGGWGRPDTAAIRTAVENQDYTAWKELHNNRPLAADLSEEDFAKVTAMHQLRIEGQFEEAEAIQAELGLGNGQQAKQGQANGNGQGQARGAQGNGGQQLGDCPFAQ